MTTRGEINSNFYQIVNVDGNGAPTSVKPEYLPNVGNANYAANAGHANVADSANSVAGANVSGAVAFATTANSVAGANVSGQVSYAATANSVAGANVSGQVGYAAVANSVAGSNVSGQVGYAAVANSVAVANVSGIGNIATVNLDGSTTHVLYGNGAWADVSAANAANANYANFAGTAYSVSAANVSGLGNIATVNLDGNVSNVLSGIGTWVSMGTAVNANYANYAGNAFSVSGANVSGTVAFANVANTVSDNAQPNITSVGNLVDLTVSGNVAAEEVLFVGAGANSASFINPTLIAKNTGATYIQAAIINDSANGSSDWVAYGDNSTDVNAWADMGFTSSNFSDPLYTITGSNDGYFFVQGDGSSIHGANLVIATGAQGTTKDIVFATGGFLANNEKMRFINATNQFYIQPTTAASSSTTGALRVEGGVGVGGNIYTGGNLYVNGASDLGIVSNVHITGGTTGQYLTTDGSGGLSWTTGSSGGTPGGSNTQVQFNDAGSFGGVANLTFDKTTNTLSATNITGNGAGLTSLTGANVTGQVPYAAVANSVAGSNVSGAVGLATYATTANAVAGANVSGQVSFAATANAVAVANVSGIGNIATVNLTGSSSNVLYGNGVFAAVANANSATQINYTNSYSAGTYFIPFVSGNTTGYKPAVFNPATGAGLGLNYVSANGTVKATEFNGDLVFSSGSTTKVTFNGSSEIDIDISGTTRLAATNSGIDVTGQSTASTSMTAPRFISNVATGTAPFTVTSTTQVANLNVATAGTAGSATTAGTVTTNAQPNITSVGTLSGLSVTATITGNISGSAGSANSVAGANVSGQVGFAAVANSVAVANVAGIGNIATINLTGSSSNVLYGNGVFAGVTATSANYANFAGDVVNASQANITSLGTLTGLTVSGVTNLGSVANINISGGSANYVLQTNGSGNLSWVAQTGGGGSTTTDFTPSFLLGGM